MIETDIGICEAGGDGDVDASTVAAAWAGKQSKSGEGIMEATVGQVVGWLKGGI